MHKSSKVLAILPALALMAGDVGPVPLETAPTEPAPPPNPEPFVPRNRRERRAVASLMRKASRHGRA